MAKTAKCRVGILVYDDCSAWIVLGIRELFDIANAAARAELFDVRLLSKGGAAVRATCGVFLEGSGSWRPCDVLVVPPVWHRNTDELERALARLRATISRLWSLAGRSGLVTGACSGSVLLAEAGLLDGKTATACWWLRGWFASRYPQVNVRADRLVVKDGSTWTAGAGTAYMHLCLEILQATATEELARKVAPYLLVEPNRDSQAVFTPSVLHYEHELLQKANAFLLGRLDRAVSAEDLAAATNVSVRTLFRRFQNVARMTPLEFVQAAKMERAKHLLAHTNKSVDTITGLCGYEDVSSFRKLFRSKVGMTPGNYRERFSSSVIR